MKFGILVLADEYGQFAHMMSASRKSGGKRCHCDPMIRVSRKKLVECPVSQPLTCVVCEKKRQDLESFWMKQAELHPEEKEYDE